MTGAPSSQRKTKLFRLLVDCLGFSKEIPEQELADSFIRAAETQYGVRLSIDIATQCAQRTREVMGSLGWGIAEGFLMLTEYKGHVYKTDPDEMPWQMTPKGRERLKKRSLRLVEQRQGC